MKVGESGVVGAGSVLLRDVPAGSVYVGNPAHELQGSKYSRK